MSGASAVAHGQHVGVWLGLLLALPSGCLAYSSVDDSAALLQKPAKKPKLGHGAKHAAPQEPRPPDFNNLAEGTWWTSSFGACSESCGTPLKSRDVICRSWKTGNVLDDKECLHRSRPRAVAACSCAPKGLEVCVNASKDCPVEVGDVLDEGQLEHIFAPAGCYARSEEPSGTQPCPADPHEFQCMNWNLNGRGRPCRGGLPFYRVCDPGNATACAEFCLRKGLDISGVVVDTSGVIDVPECRCGASVLNEEVWHEELPSTDLIFNTGYRNQSRGACDVFMTRYAGFFEFGGVPRALVKDIFLTDNAYIDSLVANRHMRAEGEEDTPAGPDDTLAEVRNKSRAFRKHMQKRAKQTPVWERPCYPSGLCTNWAAPVQERLTTAPAGIEDVWQEYVMIYYYFTADIDDTRKTVFREACKKWYSNTCVVMSEVASQPAGKYVQVAITNAGKCSVSPRGDYAIVNLGWCKDSSHLISIVHEIGHVFGMDHVQKRADAVVENSGKGPNLKVHWQNIPSRWRPQYYPDDDTYIGSQSAEDTPGDPHKGYAPYNFESVLHYPSTATEGIRLEGIPHVMTSFIGQRSYLSMGDIKQVWDIFQCVNRAGITTTTMTTTTFVATMLCGACQTYFNGYYFLQGTTASGRPWYKSSVDAYLFYDPKCGGYGTARWMITTTAPDPTKVEALAGSSCSMSVYLESQDMTLPASAGWKQWCSGAWQTSTITIALGCDGSAVPTSTTITIAPAVATTTTTTTTATTVTTITVTITPGPTVTKTTSTRTTLTHTRTTRTTRTTTRTTSTRSTSTRSTSTKTTRTRTTTPGGSTTPGRIQIGDFKFPWEFWQWMLRALPRWTFWALLGGAILGWAGLCLGWIRPPF